MLDFFKRLYEEAYDFPYFYLEIENELYCHIFTIFFILSIFLSFAYLFKIIRNIGMFKKEKKKMKKDMDKMILRVLENKNKK